MIRSLRLGLVISALTVFPADARADTQLVSIETPRGATQSFILIKPDKPVASVILFSGHRGRLGLKSASTMRGGATNFLVRSRDLFAAQNLMVAVADTPSDRRDGMNSAFRMSAKHAGDIGAIAAYLKAQANVPVWLVGTSMGTFSAAEGAIASKDVDGLVLTSTVTRPEPDWTIAADYPNGVASMPLQKVTVPTLILAHRDDGCDVSPPSGAAKLSADLTGAKTVETVVLDGGSPPRTRACKSLSQHGYFGIEEKAVGTIAAFIKKQRE